jgi:hypothetical protein
MTAIFSIKLSTDKIAMLSRRIHLTVSQNLSSRNTCPLPVVTVDGAVYCVADATVIHDKAVVGADVLPHSGLLVEVDDGLVEHDLAVVISDLVGDACAVNLLVRDDEYAHRKSPLGTMILVAVYVTKNV